MARYINVDDLEKCFEDFSYYYLHNYKDLSPVIHAHWRTKTYGYAILNVNDEVMWLAGVPCSRCGITGQTNWKYCPNCGAKMDEDINDET